MGRKHPTVRLLSKIAMTYMLPADVPYFGVSPDPYSTTSSVALARNWVSFTLGTTDIAAFTTLMLARQPTNTALATETAIWPDLLNSFYYVHVPDPFLWGIHPAPAIAPPPSLDSVPEGHCTYGGNFTDLVATPRYTVGDQVLKGNVPLSMIEIVHVVTETGLAAVTGHNPPTAVRTSSAGFKEAKPTAATRSSMDQPNVDTYTGRWDVNSGDRFFPGLTSLTSKGYEGHYLDSPYGAIHPVVTMRDRNGTNRQAFWVDANSNQVATVTVRFHLTCDTTAKPNGDTFYPDKSAGPLTFGLILMGGHGIVLRPDYQDDQTALPIAAYPLDTVIPLAIQITCSGYYSLAFWGAFQADFDTYLGPKACRPTLVLDSFDVRTGTSVVTRHRVNSELNYSTVGVTATNGENISTMPSAMIRGSSLLLSNDNPLVVRGGIVYSARVTATGTWNDAVVRPNTFCPGTADRQARAGIRQGQWENGVYSWWKPSVVPRQKALGESYEKLDDSIGICMTARISNTENPEDSLGSYNIHRIPIVRSNATSEAATTLRATMAVTHSVIYQFATTSQTFQTHVIPPGSLADLVAELEPFDVFYENPIHFLSVIQDFLGKARGAIRDTASAVGPLLGAGANALSAVPHPYAQMARNGLRAGSEIANILARLAR